MPLIRRVPKRGFHNLFRKEFAIVNVGQLEKLAADEVTPQSLLKGGVLSSLRDGLKILGDGELKRPLKVSAHRVSKSAREKIEAAGGTIELLSAPQPVRQVAAGPRAQQSAAAPQAAPAKAKETKGEKAKPAGKPSAKAKPVEPKTASKKAAAAKPAKDDAKGKAGGEARKKK